MFRKLQIVQKGKAFSHDGETENKNKNKTSLSSHCSDKDHIHETPVGKFQWNYYGEKATDQYCFEDSQ